MTAPQRVLDRTDTTRVQYELDLAFRNALLGLLRAWEDRCGLPRSIPTKVERGEVAPKQEHHNRG